MVVCRPGVRVTIDKMQLSPSERQGVSIWAKVPSVWFVKLRLGHAVSPSVVPSRLSVIGIHRTHGMKWVDVVTICFI